MKLSVLPTQLRILTGGEKLHVAGVPYAYADGGATVLDFWKWAFSDVLLDTTRGKFAEFLVAWLIGEGGHPPPTTTEYDVEGKNGMRIEVKSTAYRQSWLSTTDRNTAPTFSGFKRYRYVDRRPVGKRDYLADIYVLTLLAETDQGLVDPTDLAQWEFFVLSKKELRKASGDKGAISLTRVRAAVSSCRAQELASRIEEGHYLPTKSTGGQPMGRAPSIR